VRKSPHQASHHRAALILGAAGLAVALLLLLPTSTRAVTLTPATHYLLQGVLVL